jgi:hypothetical protein
VDARKLEWSEGARVSAMEELEEARPVVGHDALILKGLVRIARVGHNSVVPELLSYVR